MGTQHLFPHFLFAACDYAKQRKEKEEKIARNKKEFETKREKVLSLKRELDEGLENGKEFQKQFQEEGCDDHCLIRRKLKVNPENPCKASRIKKDVEENEKSNRSIKMGIASREEKCHSSRRKEKIECLHKENINQIRTSLESRLEKAACDYAKQRKETYFYIH